MNEIKLTPKQEKFCHNYIISGNATDAAIKAGYSKNTARCIAAENLSKPYIKEYIDNHMKELTNSLIADEVEILQFYTDIIRDKESDKRDRIKAADSLAKTKGMFLDRLEQKSDITYSVIPSDVLSPEE